jgi:hypothetical protein
VSAKAAIVAEAMYQAARAATPAKTPESLTDLSPAPQRRYLMLAEAAISALRPAPVEAGETR